MRSIVQLSRPRLICRPVLHANEPSCKGLGPLWRAAVRAEHGVATPPAPKVDPSLDTCDSEPRRKRHVSNPRQQIYPLFSQHAVYLRDACSCHQCVDPSTSQKLFETADIPLDIKVQSAESSPDGSLSVRWDNDIPGYTHHTSTYTKSLLMTTRALRTRLRSSHNSMIQTPWDRVKIESENLILDYDSYMSSSSTLHRALHHLHEYGLFFLASVPSDSTSISTIATRIGPLQNTLYGPTWDVRSVPSPKNVAYTSSHLGFHMDLLYMADPPKVQVLHCMKASTQGGESLFSDALAAVFAMLRTGEDDKREKSKSMFHHAVTYRYKNDGQWYQYNRPTLETNYPWSLDKHKPKLGRITAINWGPPFQAPFEIDIRQPLLEQYLKMAKEFKARVEDEAAVFETRIDEGTCVVFDNRRVLHARRAFSSEGGERWLRGAYVGGDAFMSRLRMLNEEHGRINRAEPKVEATV